MYLTSHRVRDSASGGTGYNGSLYLHGDNVVPEKLDPTRVSEERPGECIAKIETIPAGGNQVDSFLDLVGPDSATPDQIRAVLQSFDNSLTETDRGKTKTFTTDAVAIRCRISNRSPGSVSDELERLTQVALNLVQLRDGDPVPSLIIHERREPKTGWSFNIAEESESHLPEKSQKSRVLMNQEERSVLEEQRGSIYPLLADLLISPKDEALHRFSRVVVHGPNGEIRWSSERNWQEDELTD